MLAHFARRHLWRICAAVSVGSQCIVARCIVPTAVDTMPPAVHTHGCVLCCIHTRIESHKRCPKSLDANVCGRTAVLAGTASLVDVKVLRVLQRAMNTSKAGPAMYHLFDYTSYFVTVGLSSTVQLRLLGNYSAMLELLESLLCCLARHFFFLLLSFPDVIKTCYSTSVCQALRHQAYTNTLATFGS